MVSIKPKKLGSKKTNITKVLKSKKDRKIPNKPVIKEAVKTEVSNTKENTKPQKKAKYVLPSKNVTPELVTKCLTVLQQLDTQYKSKKNKIFIDETPIFAELRCLKIQNSKGNVKFVLPHSSVASTGEVCLITPDLKKGRKPDHEPTVDHWEEILRKAGVDKIKTILPMRQLRVEYDQFELKRRLLTQHDFIMVDTRVLNHVSHLLGKMFFKKHNMLIPVRIDEKGDIKKQIDIGLQTAMLRVNEGETSTIVVGHTGMPQIQVQENVMSLVKQLNDKYPGGEANIRSISLKMPLSPCLPIFVTLRSSNTVTAPKLKHKKPKSFIDVEDELSTIPGSKVKIAPDGTVHLRKIIVESDMEEDEQKSEAGSDNEANNSE